MKKEILRLRFENLRNEAHVEYNSTFTALVDKYTAIGLNIEALYDEYKLAFADEISALDIIRKSAYTKEIIEQDHARDDVFRGLTDAVKSALHHFDENKRKAAERLDVVFSNYGNIARKTLDQETAAVDDILRELNSETGKPLVTLLGLADWVAQLGTENDKFKQLMLDRYAEAAQRPTVKMHDTRGKVDKCLRAIFDRIEALVLIEGTSEYVEFINELNKVDERYNNIMAQEKGERKNKTDAADE